jgi:hypothetical protein
MNEVLKTRNGTVYQRGHQNLRPMPEGRSRVEKSPKPKKPKREKGVKAEKKVAKLERPLSELTKDWTHVPVVDIEAYVNRSAEERRREVEEGKNPGKVKRPMNSFMLYRKAYQNRTKDWCLQNNHQVVSQVCGDSWPLEPDEVKEQFTEWAKIERQNHQNAHPGYKFSPTKPGIAKISKRKMSEEIISEESDLDDFEWQSSSTRRVKKQKHVPSTRMEQSVQYPMRRSAYQHSSREHSIEPNHVPYNRSSYQATNPGKPLPTQYSQGNLRVGEYYQQATHNHPSMHGVQDIIIKKAVAPGMQYLGLPGGQEPYDLMNNFPQYEGHGLSEHRIDPSLGHHDQASIYDGNSYIDPMSQNLYFAGGQNTDQHWESQYTAGEHDPAMSFIDPDLHHDGAQIQDPHMHVLKGHQDGWNIVETLDAGGEFDKWMDEV